jgi:hypothetical protein
VTVASSPHPTADLFYKKQPSVNRKFLCSQRSEAWLGPPAQRHVSCGNLGDQTAKETRQGAPNKPHNVSSLEGPPIRRPTVGMLRFFIKLLLIQLLSNSFLQLLNTTHSLLVIICRSFHSGRVLFVFSSIHSLIHSDWLCRKLFISRSFVHSHRPYQANLAQIIFV